MVAWHRFALFVMVAGCSFDSPPPAPDAADTRLVVSFATAESGADEFQVAPSMITVQLDRVTSVPVTVACTVVANSGTATPGEDFVVQSTEVTFAAGEQTKVFAVSIVKDTIDDEPSETFELQLSNPSDNARLGDIKRHTVTISNLKLPRARFNELATITSEGTPTQLVVNLDTPAQGASSVVIGISGTASPNKDFTFTDNTQIPIADGSSMASVAIGELDDLLDEDEENVVFTIVGASPNIVLESGRTQTHAITDNDNPPTVGFGQATSMTAEGANAVLVVQLSAPSGKTINVDFARDAGGDAEAGDVTVVAGTLTFAPEETSKEIIIGVVDDTTDEDNETAVITLSNPINASLAGATHTLTVTDNDDPPAVRFAAATSSDGEGTATHIITVQLAAASEKTVTVDFAVDATGADKSTADDPGDYSITGAPNGTGTITFAVGGGLNKSITLDVVDDNSNEQGGETVIIDLGNAVNGTLTNQTVRHTHTIVDND
jgi:hypothetical protein